MNKLLAGGQFVKLLETESPASACIRKLLDNATAAHFLKAGHSDLFSEFEQIAATEALQAAAGPALAKLFIHFLLNNSADLPCSVP